MVQTKEARGASYVVFAHIAFTVMICLVRLAQVDNGGVAALFRFATGVMVIVGLSFTGKVELILNDKRGLFWRGVIGGTATGLGFIGVTEIGLIKASLIINTYPIFGTIFGIFILKEKVSKSTMAAMAVAFMGLMMVLSKGESLTAISFDFDLYTILTIVGAILGGLSVVQIKRLTKSESSSSIFLAQCLVGSFIMLIPAGSMPIELSQKTLAILIMMGVFATVGQLFITEGIRHVKIATSSLISMLGPILTIFAGAVLFDEPFTSRMGIGVIITLSALLVIGLKK